MTYPRAWPSIGGLLRRPISRHNVNITRAQLRLLLGHLAGAPRPSGGRDRFERRLARYLDVSHVTTVASGRAALALSLRVLGLPPGGLVGLPRYCFYSLVGVVRALGLRPVFVSVEPGTLAMDPEALSAVVGDLCCVILIHPFGQLAPVLEVASVCRGAGVPLVEDASQSTGATLEGRQAGSFGRVGVLSLVSGKNLQTFGGGVVATDDTSLDARLTELIARSAPTESGHTRAAFRSGLTRWALSAGPGFRIGTLPMLVALSELSEDRYAALLREEKRPFDAGAQLKRLADVQGEYGCLDLEQLERRNAVRRRNAAQLAEDLDGMSGIQLQRLQRHALNTFNAVAVRVTDGTGFARELLRRGVDTRLDYMEWFGGARDFHEDVVYLPNHPGLEPRDVARVVEAVRAVLEIRRRGDRV